MADTAVKPIQTLLLTLWVVILHDDAFTAAGFDSSGDTRLVNGFDGERVDDTYVDAQ